MNTSTFYKPLVLSDTTTSSLPLTGEAKVSQTNSLELSCLEALLDHYILSSVEDSSLVSTTSIVFHKALLNFPK